MSLGGVFLLGGTCDDCDSPGTCCWVEGWVNNCEPFIPSSSDCVALSGVFYPDLHDCAICETGACYWDDTCQDQTTIGFCQAMNGTFIPGGECS